MRSGKITPALVPFAIAIFVFVGLRAEEGLAETRGLSNQSLVHQVSARRISSLAALRVAPELIVSESQDEQAERAEGEPPAESDDAIETEPSLDMLSRSSDALTPLQNRDLTLRVQAVSISNDRIGTGQSPEPVKPTWSPGEYATSIDPRFSMATHVHWHASLIQHHPLYFEDAMLERHGATRTLHGHECAQSLISGAKFFATIPLLPYLRTLQPKHECVYSLGNYRPGSEVPCLRSNLPYDSRAALVESASVVAFFWAAPL